jgi:bifunctional non-homologous end joining protein LigD
MKRIMLMTFLAGICCGDIVMKASAGSLRTYQKKRRFTQTPEPAGKLRKKTSKKPIFVIQEHHARSLHHDFRLEVDGVLVSWAIPKGLPKRVGIKRLAVQTEDHPLEYATFAGTIPAGEYGAGKVSIVDHGTYTNIRIHHDKHLTMPEALKGGTVEVCLHGGGYSGCYVLIRTTLGRGAKNDWLVMRMKRETVEEKRKIFKGAI